MKIIAIILNIIFPGIGTILIKKVSKGVIQIILTVIAIILTATGVLSVIGIPLFFIVLIWSLVSIVSYQEKPQEVIIVKQS